MFKYLIENQNLMNQIEALKSAKLKVEIDIEELKSEYEKFKIDKAVFMKDKEWFETAKKEFESQMNEQNERMKGIHHEFDERLRQENAKYK